ncbi:zinc-ribbon domain-containing protein [Dorea sp.]
MYCKKCGKKLPDGSKFCGVCGAKQDFQVIQKIEKQNVSKRSEFSLKSYKMEQILYI